MNQRSEYPEHVVDLPDTERGPAVRVTPNRRSADRCYSSSNVRLFSGLTPEELVAAVTAGWLTPIAAPRMSAGYPGAQVRVAWTHHEMRVAMAYAALRRSGLVDEVAAHAARQAIDGGAGEEPMAVTLTPGVTVTIGEELLSGTARAPRAPRLVPLGRRSSDSNTRSDRRTPR